MVVHLAGRAAAVAVALCLGLAPAACGQGSPVPGGQSLEFEEQTPIRDGHWTITGPADKWVLVASDDAELSEALAETAVWHAPGLAPELPEVPAIPEGQTALLYFAGDLPGSAVVDLTLGVYESDREWTVAVERVDTGEGGTDAIISVRHLVFVDAPAPESVRLRFEDTRSDPPEVTWW